MQILLIMLIVVLLAFLVLLLALAKQSPREKQTEDKEQGILSKIDNIYPCSDHGTDYLRKRFPQYKQKVHTRFLY